MIIPLRYCRRESNCYNLFYVHVEGYTGVVIKSRAVESLETGTVNNTNFVTSSI